MTDATQELPMSLVCSFVLAFLPVQVGAWRSTWCWSLPIVEGMVPSKMRNGSFDLVNLQSMVQRLFEILKLDIRCRLDRIIYLLDTHSFCIWTWNPLVKHALHKMFQFTCIIWLWHLLLETFKLVKVRCRFGSYLASTDTWSMANLVPPFRVAVNKWNNVKLTCWTRFLLFIRGSWFDVRCSRCQSQIKYGAVWIVSDVCKMPDRWPSWLPLFLK